MSVDRAIENGERDLRRALRIAHEGRANVAEILKVRDEIDAETIATVEADVRQFDQVIAYASLVLSMLPTPPQERLRALHEGLTNLQVLAADR
jgi:hypothetical protein